MNTKKQVLIHILCWTLLLGYYYIGDIIKNNWRDDVWHFDVTMNFLHIVEFYICYLWVYPCYLRKTKVPQLIGGITLVMAVFISLRYLLEEVLNRHFLDMVIMVKLLQPFTISWTIYIMGLPI
jgi:two-component system LytT family sensor kinase